MIKSKRILNRLRFLYDSDLLSKFLRAASPNEISIEINKINKKINKTQDMVE